MSNVNLCLNCDKKKVEIIFESIGLKRGWKLARDKMPELVKGAGCVALAMKQ